MPLSNAVFPKHLEIRNKGGIFEDINCEALHNKKHTNRLLFSYCKAFRKNAQLLPDKLTLDFDNYEKWKARNKPTVKLTGQYYYLIGFEKSYKNEKEN